MSGMGQMRDNFLSSLETHASHLSSIYLFRLFVCLFSVFPSSLSDIVGVTGRERYLQRENIRRRTEKGILVRNE